jgi:hypothetical protein
LLHGDTSPFSGWSLVSLLAYYQSLGEHVPYFSLRLLIKAALSLVGWQDTRPIHPILLFQHSIPFRPSVPIANIGPNALPPPLKATPTNSDVVVSVREDLVLLAGEHGTFPLNGYLFYH